MPSVKAKVVNHRRTICEVHREIYDILEVIDINSKTKEKMVDLLEEVFIMGKKMSSKLHQYKFKYDDTWWEKNIKYTSS